MIKNWGGHKFRQPEDCDVHHFEWSDCYICDGHLQWCVLCKEGEGDLEPICPRAFAEEA